MLNILYFICLHLFLCIIIKPKNLLSCGLFGFSGDDLPDFKTLKFLGLLNTSRGTDSCGVYYNRKIRKDIASFADELVLADNTPKRNVDHNVYIGHTRSRSVGSVSTSNAHPFLYYTEKSGKDENGNNEYITTFDHDEYYNEVFAHNGTLKNWEELAKETNHDIKDLDIDSKLLGQLVCEDIKKAVTQYTGAAAFLYTSLHGSKSLYAWKGAAGGILERPLHYIKAKEGYYLSSVRSHLELAFPDNKKNIKEIKDNELLEFQGSKIVSRTIIPREYSKSRKAHDAASFIRTSSRGHWNGHSWEDNTNSTNFVSDASHQYTLNNLLKGQIKKINHVYLNKEFQYCTLTKDNLEVKLNGTYVINRDQSISIATKENETLHAYFVNGFIYLSKIRYEKVIEQKFTPYQIKYNSIGYYISSGPSKLICQSGQYADGDIYPMFSNLYLEVSNGKVVDGLNYGSSLRNETLNLNTGIKQKDTLEEDITEEDNTYYTELEADFIEEMHGMKAWIESIATKYKELYVNTQQTSNTELMEVFKALNSLDKTI